MNRFLKNTVSLFLLLTITFSCQQIKNKKETQLKTRPNIIFVFADDWGFGDLGCYGSTEVLTPNLDKLAAEGTRFTKFHVTSGVCSPSRSSIITGHFPAKHKVHGHFAGNHVNAKRGMPNYLNDSLDVYMPKVMKQAGYITAHFGKWHLGGGGKPHGDPSAPEPKKYGYDVTRVWNGNGPTWKGDQKFPSTRYMDNDTLWIQSSSKIAVNATIEFLTENKAKDKPMFVNLWLKDPHTPLYPSDEQRKPYKGIDPDKETYFSVLTDADRHIGRLMSAIKDLGIDENTLVVFSSDNGPAHYGAAMVAGSTAGLKGRKVDIFEGGINVPFIVRWPNHVKQDRLDTISILSSVDLLPTFAELANTELPKDYIPDGEKINDIFSNNTFNRTKPLFWEWKFPLISNKNHKQNRWPQGAVILGKWKLLFNSTINREELYDLNNDHNENYDLSQNHPQKVSELKKLWKNWKTTLPK